MDWCYIPIQKEQVWNISTDDLLMNGKRICLRGIAKEYLDRTVIEEILELGESRFFTLLKEYSHNSGKFYVAYQRESPTREFCVPVGKEIEEKLTLEESLIDDRTLPINNYNYSAIRDRLAKREIIVALSTIIERAKTLDCYHPHRRKKAHDCEVVTAAIGALIQHDGSPHRRSAYAKEKWVSITSLNDFSRNLLNADLFEQETSRAHIRASQALVEFYGIPFRYYADSSRVFRFVESSDSIWRKHALQTDEADPQF